MKENYENAEIEIIRFDVEDIIITSCGSYDPNEGELDF